MDTPSESPSTENGGEPTELAPLTPWTTLLGIVIRPRATFRRMREAKRRHWWLILVLSILIAALLAYANTTVRFRFFQAGGFPGAAAGQTFQGGQGGQGFQGGGGQGFQSGTPQPGQTPQAGQSSQGGQASQTGQRPTTFRSPISTPVALLISVGLGTARTLLGYLICAVVLYGMGLVMGGQATFKQLFPVAAWATLPFVLRDLIHAVMTLVTGRVAIAGIAGVFSPQEAASLAGLYSILSQFDVFLLWSMVLLGVGVAVTAKLSIGKSIVVVLTYAVISAGLLLALGLAGRALGGLFGGGGGRGGARVPGLFLGGGRSGRCAVGRLRHRCR